MNPWLVELGDGFADRGDAARAQRCYRRAAGDGSLAAMVSLGELDETTLAGRARDGDTAAMVALGHLHDRREDVAGAERWYQQAAEAGDVIAMIRLAVLLWNDDSREGWTDERADSARPWLEKAAATGDAEAMHQLGTYLIEHWGLEDEGLEWLRRAAEAGHGGAMNAIGEQHDFNEEPDEAEEWWRRSAAAGDKGGMDSLASLLRSRGDAAEADEWAARSRQVYAWLDADG